MEKIEKRGVNLEINGWQFPAHRKTTRSAQQVKVVVVKSSNKENK